MLSVEWGGQLFSVGLRLCIVPHLRPRVTRTGFDLSLICRMFGELWAGRQLWGNSGGVGTPGRRSNIKHGQHQTTNNSSNYNIKNITSNVFANLGGRQTRKRGNQSWTLHCWQPHTAGVGRYEKYRGSSDWRLHQICLSLSWLFSPTFQTPEIR